MACNVNQLVAGNIKAFGASDEPEELEPDFLSTIKKLTYDLDRADCGDVVFNYFNEKSGGSLQSGYDSILKYGNIGSAMTTITGLSKRAGLPTDEITETLCVTLSQWYKQLIHFIEDTLKIVPTALRKIDALRGQVEQAIINFGLEIRDCILDVLTDAKVGINKVMSGVIDLEVLQKLMQDCPCVMDAMKSLFGCDDANTPYEVRACIEDLMSIGLGLDFLNDFMDNILKAAVETAFNVFENAVKSMMALLMTPLRLLVKTYCELLNTKIPMGPLIDSLGHFECFFIYGEQTKPIPFIGGTVTYTGMSIIDIIDTFKLWAGCLDTVCSSLTDDLKRDIKNFNEQLRLHSSYWDDPITLDIYQSCMVGSAQLAQTPRDSAIRKIYVEKQDSSKAGLVQLYDAAKDLGKADVSATTATTKMGGTELRLLKPEPESAIGTDTSTFESTQDFYDGTQSDLVLMVDNMKDAILQEGYYRLVMNMKMWSFPYKKEIDLLNAFDDAEQEFISVTRGGADSTVEEQTVSTARPFNKFRVQRDNDSSLDVLNESKEPTYSITDDYNEMSFGDRPTRSVGESLVSNYVDWYNNGVVV
jgi:hypothetical protein